MILLAILSLLFVFALWCVVVRFLTRITYILDLPGQIERVIRALAIMSVSSNLAILEISDFGRAISEIETPSQDFSQEGVL